MSTQSKQLTIADSLSNQVTIMKPQFQMALPSHIDPDKFVRSAITLIKTNTYLQKCTPMSIFSSLLKCANDGLIADGIHGAIIPYGETATYVPMLQGILRKIRNTGEVTSVFPEIVHAEDKFTLFIDETGKHFKHEPNLDIEDRGVVVGFYAVAKLTNGDTLVEYMSKAAVDKIRNKSKQKDGTAWRDNYEEMGKKTVVRRLNKYLPNSAEIDSLFKKDDAFEVEQEPQVKDVTTTEKSKTSRLKKIIEAKAQQIEQVETVEETASEVEL